MSVIHLQRRSWFGRLLRVPAVFRMHYDILRRHNSFAVSAIAALRSSLLLLRG
jgi:hypothetical protein